MGKRIAFVTVESGGLRVSDEGGREYDNAENERVLEFEVTLSVTTLDGEEENDVFFFAVPQSSVAELGQALTEWAATPAPAE